MNDAEQTTDSAPILSRAVELLGDLLPLDRNQAAQILGTTPGGIETAQRTGRLKATQLGKRQKFLVRDLRDYLRAQNEQG